MQIVEGDVGNVKITTAEDLERARERRAGVHASASAPATICTGWSKGVARSSAVWKSRRAGALGHSDADVACHAATDALLGAACLGDIGRHFPDTDPRWKGASSIELLRQAAALVASAGFGLSMSTSSVMLERRRSRRISMASAPGLPGRSGLPSMRVSIKGKTNEGVDAIGRGEAIAAHAVALLRIGARREPQRAS